jgi:hypothetical protein
MSDLVRRPAGWPGIVPLLASITFALGPSPVADSRATAAGDPDAAAALGRFLARPARVHEYVASRRLEASGWGHHGWLDADTSFTIASGLSYEVTSEGGSGYIRARVLRSLLDAERDLIARGDGLAAALSAANYRFTPEGIDDEGLAVIRLLPLRKETALIAGRMLLTPDTGDLVRVEGRLSRNPSFWVSRASIVRSHRRIDGAVMPVSLDTTAHLRLLGSSALRMTYEYSRIDERQVVPSESHPGNESELPFAVFDPFRGG